MFGVAAGLRQNVARYGLLQMSEVGELNPEELKRWLDRGDRPVVLDVREPEEVAIASMAGAVRIPMGDLPARLSELDPERDTVVICHHGIRSAQVAAYLAQSGFARVFNLWGGIDAWSLAVDPSVARY